MNFKQGWNSSLNGCCAPAQDVENLELTRVARSLNPILKSNLTNALVWRGRRISFVSKT